MENVTIMKRFRCSLLVKANSAVYVQLNIFAYVTATARLEILSHIFQMFLQVLFFFSSSLLTYSRVWLDLVRTSVCNTA